MATTWDDLGKVLQNPLDTRVYYLASTEEAQLREAAAMVKKALQKAGVEEESSRIDGPSPDLGEVVAAAGAISFFGTPRLVELWEIAPTQIKDKDAEELAALFAEVENAVLVVTVLYKDKKAAQSKKAKALFDAARKEGFAAEFAKPTRRENLAFIQKQAEAVGAALETGAAEELLDRAGDSHPLLQNEVAKLAAFCGYGTITKQAVQQYGVHNIETDVFRLVRAITDGRRAAAYETLNELLQLRHEPIAIAAALSGSYVDMYRVRAGIAAKKPLGTIFKELGYKGNEYRLQKSKENAAQYSTEALQQCVLCLYRLDRQLKSSALPDKGILLQAALAQLMQYRGGGWKN